MCALEFYKTISQSSEPLLRALLSRRLASGKEHGARLGERQGNPGLPRPSSPLIWIHAASVGEAQSALILLDLLLKKNAGIHILMTTGTISSASLMQKNLPSNVIHQFYPLDHPRWVKSFLDHWRPNLVLWMESELWPNMLGAIKKRNIPAILVNARLSEKSFSRWSWIKSSAQKMLSAFSLILAQSEKEALRYRMLGAGNVTSTGNIKYSAKPLGFSSDDLKNLHAKTYNRPLWLFASTHKGEEEMACRIHQKLKNSIPGLLTLIVPRHPDRRAAILQSCQKYNLAMSLRGAEKNLPDENTDIYIADTFGELGLFYRLSPVACIGRSFSDDGGGGHNPIEAAQLNCVVLHGPGVQFQKELYNEMNDAGVAFSLKNESELASSVHEFLSNPEKLEAAQKNALNFTLTKTKVIDEILERIDPFLDFSPKQKTVQL